jgi:hypothetical protein
MHIEVDTADLSAREAAGLIALLVTLHPNCIAEIDVSHRALIAGADLGETIPGDTRHDVPAALRVTRVEDIDAIRTTDAGHSVSYDTAADDEPDPVDPVAAFAPDPAVAFSGGGPIVAPAAAPGPALAPSAVVGVELDSRGLPWDARIHAGGKTKNADGSWRGKRGVAADTIAAVTAELKALMAIPGPQSDTGTAGAPPAPPAPATLASAPPVPSNTPAPPASIPPPSAPPSSGGVASPPASSGGVAQPPPAPPPATSPPVMTTDAGDFQGVMRKITAAQSAGKLTGADVLTIVADMGMASIRDLLTRPDLIPGFNDQVDSYIATAG